MAEMDSLHDAFVEEIKDLYDAEHQLIKALPKMSKTANSPELRKAIDSHLQETRGQVTRLEKIFEYLDEKPKGKHCAGIAGIIEEASDTMKEDAPGAVMDACIIAGGQRAEHYEMAAYGTVVAWAEALELPEIAQLLNETLAEERAADEKLTSLAEAGINDAAIAGEDDNEDEHKEKTTTSASGKRPTKRSRA